MDANVFELNSKIEMTHWWFVARRRIISRLVTHLIPPSPSRTVVDVGCGTGGNLSQLANDYQCIGIDPSEEAIHWAKKRFPHMTFVHGYAPEDLNEDQRQADVFMLNDVLEHVPDDFSLLSNLLAASKPGSYFVITVPADMSLWSPHDVSHGHYRRYTLERLSAVWKGLPVRCVLCSHFNSRLYPIVKFLRGINRRNRAASGDQGTDLKVPSRWVNASLTQVFEGESRRLLDLLDRGDGEGYRRGVSLVAILSRNDGEMTPRNRPPALDDDPALRESFKS